jgi:hypothetical protein
MKDPQVSRRTIDHAFVREHFGSNDLRLARLPYLLGVNVPRLLQSYPQADLRTNLWLAQAFHKRLEAERKNLGNALSQLKTLKVNCAEAEKLLKRVRPGTARQRERVAFWQWAIRVLGFYAEHAPAWLKGEKPAASLKKMQSLSTFSGRLLGRLYTEHTVEEEQQNRFGSLEDYLRGRAAREGAVGG